jgi:hypothetical protein
MRQAKILMKYGLDPQNYNTAQATEQIQEIADRGWQWP